MTDFPYCLSQLNQGFLLFVTKDILTNIAADLYTDQLPMLLPTAKRGTSLLDSFSQRLEFGTTEKKEILG